MNKITIMLSCLLCLPWGSGAASELVSFYDTAAATVKEMTIRFCTDLGVLMPLQEFSAVSLADLVAARANNAKEVEQFRMQRPFMEEQMSQVLQQAQSSKEQIDPMQLISFLVTQRANILFSTLVPAEVQLAEPVITPAQFMAALEKHAHELVKALRLGWSQRNIEYMNEKVPAAGILAQLTCFALESTTRAGIVLWFAHNISLEQFEMSLAEHRTLLCSIMLPLSEVIVAVMK